MGITPRLHIKKMKASVMSSLVVLLALSSNSEARLQCDDCVQEMHKLGVLVKFYGEAMSQMMMACPAKGYKATMFEAKELGCDECVEGLEFISRWMLDEFVVDDMVVYLEANFCLPDMQMCDR